jgi:hypothetical protein
MNDKYVSLPLKDVYAYVDNNAANKEQFRLLVNSGLVVFDEDMSSLCIYVDDNESKLFLGRIKHDN